MARSKVTPTESELLDELLTSVGTEARRPTDVDIWQMSRLDPLHRSEKFWRKQLDAMVAEGKLVRLSVWGGKRNVTVYRNVE